MDQRGLSPRRFGFAGFAWRFRAEDEGWNDYFDEFGRVWHKEGEQEDIYSSIVSAVCVRTSTAEYQIRQPKPSKQDILPANTPVQFTLDKDLMKFKLNGKKYEFRVVGSSAVVSQ